MLRKVRACLNLHPRLRAFIRRRRHLGNWCRQTAPRPLFVANHKTGHHLSAKLGGAIADTLGLHYVDLSLATELPAKADVIVYESEGCEAPEHPYRFVTVGGVELDLSRGNWRGVHLIRHPFEIIASAYRWHLKTDRPRLTNEWRDTGKSYQAHLRDGDGIAFEMSEHSKETIMKLYSFDQSDPRFITVKLEDFEACYEATVRRIARHFQFPEEVIVANTRQFDLMRLSQLPAYVTRSTLGGASHQALFKPHHYALFDEIFPADIFARLGYERFVAPTEG